MASNVEIYLFDQHDDLEPLVRQKLNENFRRLQNRATTYQQRVDQQIIDMAGQGGGVTDYNQLTNKPSIEGITLIGDKEFPDLTIFLDTELDPTGEGGEYPRSDMYALTTQDINALWSM